MTIPFQSAKGQQRLLRKHFCDVAMLQMSYNAIKCFCLFAFSPKNKAGSRNKVEKIKIFIKTNSWDNKCCTIGMLIISLLPRWVFLQNMWKNKYCIIGIIITSVFQSTSIYLYRATCKEYMQRTTLSYKLISSSAIK